MVQEADKIKQHIENERESLSHNLDEIEYRFKDATDLKAQFERNTGLILGAAVAGGFLLSLALGRSSRSAVANRQSVFGDRESLKPASSGFASRHVSHMSETIDNIVAGLVGVFSDKLQSLVADVVPGFREQHDSFRQRDASSGELRSTFGR